MSKRNLKICSDPCGIARLQIRINRRSKSKIATEYPIGSGQLKPNQAVFPIRLLDLIEADAFIGTSKQRSHANESGTSVQGIAGTNLISIETDKQNFYKRGLKLKSKLYSAYGQLRTNSLYNKTKYNHKVAPHIVGEYNNRLIFDLDTTMIQLQTVFNVVRLISQSNGRILFVGTRSVVNEIADPINNLLNSFSNKSKPHQKGGKVIQSSTGRWLGGTLTNNDFTLSGQYLPDLIFLVDPLQSSMAINEARALGIPTVALVNSDGNPHLFTYPIVLNNKSLRTIALCAYTIFVATM